MAEITYSFEEFEYPNLEKTLDRLGAQMRDLMRQHLSENGTNASSKLSNSITYIVRKDNQDYEVFISLEDYWKWVENGTSAHWAPIKPLIEWVLVKPLIPEERNGKLPTVEQLAHAVQWKIAQEGTKAQPFFWNSVEEAVEDFEQQVEEAIEMDIDRNVDTLLLQLKF